MSNIRENQKIATVVAEALLSRQFVKVKFYNDEGDQELSGLITKIDQENKRIKLSHEFGFDWIPLDDILSMEFVP